MTSLPEPFTATILSWRVYRFSAQRFGHRNTSSFIWQPSIVENDTAVRMAYDQRGERDHGGQGGGGGGVGGGGHEGGFGRGRGRRKLNSWYIGQRVIPAIVKCCHERGLQATVAESSAVTPRRSRHLLMFPRISAVEVVIQVAVALGRRLCPVDLHYFFLTSTSPTSLSRALRASQAFLRVGW